MKLTPYQRAERAMKTQARQHYFAGKRHTAVRKVIKLNTVNVVEITNGDVQSIRSFTDNVEGNRRAEKLFKRCVKKQHADGLTKERLAEMVEEGYWYDENGYWLGITHSI